MLPKRDAFFAIIIAQTPTRRNRTGGICEKSGEQDTRPYSDNDCPDHWINSVNVRLSDAKKPSSRRDLISRIMALRSTQR